MLVKHRGECPELNANDGTRLRELLHPANDSVDLPYSIAFAELAPGEASLNHRLAFTEVYHIISGGGCMHVGAQTQVVVAGDVVLVPADTAQWLENPGTTTLAFAVIVSPPWRAEGDQLMEVSAENPTATP
jgi:mannose-6-phosphate isomerase-like protein (cupin superfamily)